jgi:hypothetical protein
LCSCRLCIYITSHHWHFKLCKGETYTRKQKLDTQNRLYKSEISW